MADRRRGRGKRRSYSKAFKRRVVAETLEPGAAAQSRKVLLIPWGVLSVRPIRLITAASVISDIGRPRFLPGNTSSAIQTALAASGSVLQLRIGLHVGDVIVEGDDLFGDGINIAARLEAEAEPGGVVVSNVFRRHAEGRAGLVFDDLGTRQLKNVAEPMQVHLLRRDGDQSGARPNSSARVPLRRMVMAGAAVVVVVVALAALWAVPHFFDSEPPGTTQASGIPAICNPYSAIFVPGGMLPETARRISGAAVGCGTCHAHMQLKNRRDA